MHTKYIVVLGSLLSGLGKGVLTASILKILDLYDYRVMPLKFDGYLNYDCGTMNPYRHGEVFVLDDKSEVDMDFGIYERFLNKSLTKESSMTSGRIFTEIISKERKGDYLGSDVQIVPHLVDGIIGHIEDISRRRKLDIMVIEVGGTVGDLENGYFIEPMRQLALRHEVIFVNITYVPQLSAVGEQKTKPTQIAFRLLMQMGIKPDFIFCRSESRLLSNIKEKIALYTSTPISRIIDDSDDPNIYSLPERFMRDGFGEELLKALGDRRSINHGKLDSWRRRASAICSKRGKTLNIFIVGKYVELRDAYVSVKEALLHAAGYLGEEVVINWLESEKLEKGHEEDYLKSADGIVVPGGFGRRGSEGMIRAIKYARENGIPYRGLCLGMQMMAVEFARNVCKMRGANSTEFDKRTKYNVIDILPSQRGIDKKGGTMRLGSWKTRIDRVDSIIYDSYKRRWVSERHRHRYEFNNKFRKRMEKAGLVFSASDPSGKLVEAIEWTGGFGIGVQSHPELKSRLEEPAPLFLSFLRAASA